MDRTEEREGWRFKDAWVGAHTDAELIGASMYEVEPVTSRGHSHPPRERGMGDRPPRRADAAHARERAAAAQGDVVAFPRGKEGAHQIRNDTDGPSASSCSPR